MRFVGRIVENLDIQELRGVVETRDSVNQALDDVALIVNGELDGDTRPGSDRGRRGRNVFRVLIVIVDQPVAMQAVKRENAQHQEVGNHHHHVEGIGVIDARKRPVGELVPVMAERTLLREEE